MSKLYELSHDLAETAEYLEGVEEDFNDESQALVKKQLDSLQVEFEDKVYGIVRFIKNLEAEVEMLDKEADHFTKRAASAKNKLKYLKNYLKFGLEVAKVEKIKVGGFRISLSDSKPSVVILGSISDIPMKYKDVKIEEVPDKNKLREALLRGETIPGVELSYNKTMRIN